MACGTGELRTSASYQMARAVWTGQGCAGRAYANQNFVFVAPSSTREQAVNGARSRGGGGLDTEGWAFTVTPAALEV